MSDPQQLIERIVENPDSPDISVLANRLLKEFHRGYRLDALRPLLRSADDGIVRTAAWIASELGPEGRPLLGDILTVLKHPSRRARFYAIDSVLSWAGPSDGAAVAAVIPLMDDSASSVRWKAMDFLARSPLEHLQGALSHLSVTEPDSSSLRRLQWLLGPGESNPEEVISAIKSVDPLVRRFAVSAAARLYPDVSQPLLVASSSDDSDVRQFAVDSIKLKKFGKN